ncbi:class I SAM-dependent methyltransferase [Roseobacter weihaiensis]|uniref:class I SAM-dependent methyltransferase n=1 Tax=Roseobacter weihaiensis TaxID=2763262 RepID=UPI001D0A2242|nr:SAM-dependent methyltransferase [Roseobacter sp. H9]
MTLTDHIVGRILASGPISVADYMAECLLHPTLGYYTTQTPFGTEGDFITAPDISQMFGEVIGLCLAQTWVDQGRPAPFTLAELGPGRGTLMADILRATSRIPGFRKAAQVSLVEASSRLQEIQRQSLEEHPVHFLRSAGDLPDAPLFLVANEFFDALPIRQFLRTPTAWRERQIGVADGSLTFGLGPETAQPALDRRMADTQDGDLVEHCPMTAPIITAISTRIESQRGAAILIDYGDWRSLGDTLQALRGHQSQDVLSAPGTCDLTAHVDFEALAEASHCAFTKLTPQGVFLERLGITQRAQTLAANLTGQPLEQHIRAHRRLTHPDEMGNLFKVLGLFPQGQDPPPGLDV